MLTEHHKVELLDKNKKHKFFAEVNWEPDNEKINNSKVIRLSCDEKYAYVDVKHFMEFLFAVGNPQQQQRLIPQTVTRVHEQQMKLAIKATKDIKKGEEIVMNDIKVSIPCFVVDKIGEVNVERKLSNLPLIGKYLKLKN